MSAPINNIPNHVPVTKLPHLLGETVRTAATRWPSTLLAITLWSTLTLPVVGAAHLLGPFPTLGRAFVDIVIVLTSYLGFAVAAVAVHLLGPAYWPVDASLTTATRIILYRLNTRRDALRSETLHGMTLGTFYLVLIEAVIYLSSEMDSLTLNQMMLASLSLMAFGHATAGVAHALLLRLDTPDEITRADLIELTEDHGLPAVFGIGSLFIVSMGLVTQIAPVAAIICFWFFLVSYHHLWLVDSDEP